MLISKVETFEIFLFVCTLTFERLSIELSLKAVGAPDLDISNRHTDVT